VNSQDTDFVAVFAPVTYRGYIVRAAPVDCAEALVQEYKRRYLQFQETWKLPIPDVNAHKRITDLAAGLENLFPLSAPPIRYLLVPTRTGAWTAIFTNNSYDENQEFMAGLNRLLGSRVVYYSSREHTLKKVRSDRYVGHWGAHSIYIFDSGKPFEPDRVISCVKENGGWKFDQFGKPLPFEDVARYELPVKRERFNGRILREYLAAMGLFPYESSFFRISRAEPGILVERTDPGSQKEIINYMPQWKIDELWFSELSIPVRVFKVRERPEKSNS
jgi:hypothetical protein